MTASTLQPTIETAWEQRNDINATTRGEVRDAVEETLRQLDTGALRVAEKVGGQWVVHQWAKKAVLLSFRLNDMEMIAGGPGADAQAAHWFDKVPSKFSGWTEQNFKTAGFREAPQGPQRSISLCGPCFLALKPGQATCRRREACS